MKDGKQATERRWNYNEWKWEVRENMADERKVITEERKRSREANKILKESCGVVYNEETGAFEEPPNIEDRLLPLPDYPDNPWEEDKKKCEVQAYSVGEFAREWLKQAKRKDDEGEPLGSMADVAKEFCMNERQVKAARTRINNGMKAHGDKRRLPKLPVLSDSQKKTAGRQSASAFKEALPDTIDDWGW